METSSNWRTLALLRRMAATGKMASSATTTAGENYAACETDLVEEGTRRHVEVDESDNF